MSDFILDESQQTAVKKLNRLVCHFVKQAKPDISDEQTEIIDEQSGFEVVTSNVFGVLGDRGSGKSTVLLKYKKDHKSDDGQVLCLNPIDCSVVSPDSPPGMVVLLHLKQYLDSYSEREYAEKKEKLFCELDELLSLYTRIGEEYRDLCLDLSSTPSDYGRYFTQGLESRLTLKQRLTNWLEDLFTELKQLAIVIPLDDFDLISGIEVRRWLASLLDELEQQRLIFVLTADFHRLEHLSWDSKEQFDDMTGWALMNKLLPSQNRINLESWSVQSRCHFPLSRSESGANQKTAVEPNDLWYKIERIVGKNGSFAALVFSLLPIWPRGLRDIYFALDSESADEESVPVRHRVIRFLPILATCRGEPLLAKRLIESRDYIDDLNLAVGSLWSEEWQSLVKQALNRANWNETIFLKPLFHLLKPPILEPIPRTYQPIQSQDPVRHHQFLERPLRDAKIHDHPLWAELLIDLTLYDLEHISNRSNLCVKWEPLLERLKRTSLKINVPADELRDFLTYQENHIERAMFYWIYPYAFQNADQGSTALIGSNDIVKLEIGWYSLLEALRDARDPFCAELLTELKLDINVFKGHLPPPDTESKEIRSEPLEILPNQLWALIILTDALDRCPWVALSALPSTLTTYIALSAALVRSAYAYTLSSTGCIEKDDLKSDDDSKPAIQVEFINCLEQRDPSCFLQQSGAVRRTLEEEELWAKLNHLFDDNLPTLLEEMGEKKQLGVLGEAALSFLKSPAYTSAVKLLKGQPGV